MRLLGIETAAFAGGVALVEDGRLVAEYTLDSGKGGHSRWLVPAIQELLEAAGWAGDALDGLAVNRGPGSFTGIRIGVATAQGLAYGWDKPLWGVEGLEALAWQAVAGAAGRSGVPPEPAENSGGAKESGAKGNRDGDRVVLSLIDARHGNVYAAAYRVVDGDLQPLVAPAAWTVEEFLDAVQRSLLSGREVSGGETAGELTGVHVQLAGDGGVAFESIIRARFPLVTPVPLDGDRLRAATVARWAERKYGLGQVVVRDGSPSGGEVGSFPSEPAAGHGRRRGQAQNVWPLYLKKSEAERKWPQSPSP